MAGVNKNISIFDGTIISDANGYAIMSNSISNLTLQAINFTADGDLNSAGVYFIGGSDVLINNCLFNQLTSTAIIGASTTNFSIKKSSIQSNGSSRNIDIEGALNLDIEEVVFYDNIVSNTLESLFLRYVSDVHIRKCNIISNASIEGDFVGIYILDSTKVLIEDCFVNTNFGYNSDAFLNKNSSDVTYRRCYALGNNGITSTNGFQSETTLSKNITYDHCVANDNVGGQVRGFFLNFTQYSCIFNCIAQQNSASGGEGIGFDLLETTSCNLRNNTAINNTGITNGIGFRATNSSVPFTAALFNNQSQGHGSLSNYVISAPGNILQVEYKVTGFPVVSATPTPLDNISIV
jgi:hypothetical protein